MLKYLSVTWLPPLITWWMTFTPITYVFKPPSSTKCFPLAFNWTVSELVLSLECRRCEHEEGGWFGTTVYFWHKKGGSKGRCNTNQPSELEERVKDQAADPPVMLQFSPLNPGQQCHLSALTVLRFCRWICCFPSLSLHTHAHTPIKENTRVNTWTRRQELSTLTFFQVLYHSFLLFLALFWNWKFNFFPELWIL